MTTLVLRSSSRLGAALVTVLVMVTIVSIALVSYLVTVQFDRNATQSYSAGVNAETIAIGGLDRLTADLLQEIKAGSTVLEGPTAESPVYYKPKDARTMVPATNNGATGYANLIRISSTNAVQFDPSHYDVDHTPVDLSVACSSTSQALGGRYISIKRWNQPQLLVAGESMPAPDWILMTRNGVIAPANAIGADFGNTPKSLNNGIQLSNTNYVIGRYAYAIYNEGGLLDANVAGCAGIDADNVGNRGSIAMVGTNSIMTSQQWSDLVQWRNKATAVDQTTYAKYIYQISATNGFLQVQPGDRTFLSRQDLIGYAKQYTQLHPSLPLTGALPYLGTFSRETNAPAYVPVASTDTNPDLLTLRFLHGGSINGGGTLLKSRNVKEGDFLLSRRFPLSRLSWVSSSGLVNGASAYDVWRAFGLVWDASNYAWVYVSAEGGTLPTPSAVKTSIKTLSQVAKEATPRDPDFFELLQAGILNGSLGQDGGPQDNTNAYGGTGKTQEYDRVKSYHIIQIGVNAIDQVRADNFPTAIRFGPDSTDTLAGGSPRAFYGIKNLPYINRYFDTYVRWINPPAPMSNNDKKASGDFPGKVYRQPYMGGWIRFELWNPHQSSNLSDLAPGACPSAIRIAASGTINPYVYSHRTDGGNFGRKGADAKWTPSTAYLELKPSSLSSFSEPKLVIPSDVTSSSPNCVVAAGDVGDGSIGFAGLYISSMYVPDWSWSGGNLGRKRPPVTASPTADPYLISYDIYRSQPDSTKGVTYVLQYKDASGTWRTYCELKNQNVSVFCDINPSTSTTSGATVDNANSTNAECRMRLDPRSDRFSTSLSRSNPVDSGESIRPNLEDGYDCSGYFPMGSNWIGCKVGAYLGKVLENTSASSVRYTDPDGTLRRGDSAYNVGGNVSGRPTLSNNYLGWSVNVARPVILNRPFRSVAELGYVFRDLPWKTLDFFTKESGDASLLDLFCVSDTDVVAGRVDLNTQNTQVLAAAIQNGAIDPLYAGHAASGGADPNCLTNTLATAVAAAFTNATKTQPLQSRAEMVTKALDSTTQETILATTGLPAAGVHAKIQRESAVRALSEVGNARTWNLFIDIIAQSGRYPANLRAGASLNNFEVDGEKRYWLHLAIDRFTGDVVDRFLEPVEQ